MATRTIIDCDGCEARDIEARGGAVRFYVPLEFNGNVASGVALDLCCECAAGMLKSLLEAKAPPFRRAWLDEWWQKRPD